MPEQPIAQDIPLLLTVMSSCVRTYGHKVKNLYRVEISLKMFTTETRGTVGHVPNRIAPYCAYLLLNGGTIWAKVLKYHARISLKFYISNIETQRIYI